MKIKTLKNKKQFPPSTNTKFLVVLAIVSTSSIFHTNTASASWTTALSWVQNKLLTSQQNDAMKTAVAQDAVSTNAIAETVLIAKQKIATTEAMLVKKINLTELYTDFMAPSANTNSARCFAVGERENDAKVSQQVPLLVKADLLNNLNSGLGYSNDFRINSLQTTKFNIACTNEQASQGYCTPTISGGQYFDTDFGMFLSSDRLLQGQFYAAKAGIYTIANTLSDDKTTSNCGDNSSCVADMEKQKQRVAVNSLVANSLLTQLYNRMNVGSTDENTK